MMIQGKKPKLTAKQLLRDLTSNSATKRQQAAQQLATVAGGNEVERIGFSWGGEVANVPTNGKKPAFRLADEI